MVWSLQDGFILAKILALKSLSFFFVCFFFSSWNNRNSNSTRVRQENTSMYVIRQVSFQLTYMFNRHHLILDEKAITIS